ncbi:MAG: LuxR C-terminal-related transcriptional regulator, partial [Coxiella burnetii]|nr:LuxR C-terminal-related transcriptional regulator [Coxiella burnetii]
MDKTKKYTLGPNFPNVTLTHREAQCVAYLLKGYSEKQIAKRLNLSIRSIVFYITSVR